MGMRPSGLPATRGHWMPKRLTEAIAPHPHALTPREAIAAGQRQAPGPFSNSGRTLAASIWAERSHAPPGCYSFGGVSENALPTPPSLLAPGRLLDPPVRF